MSLTTSTNGEADGSTVSLAEATDPAFASKSSLAKVKYADVGINLSDATFRGEYHGKKVHEDDTNGVIERAVGAGCRKFMITGSDLAESKRAIKIAEEYPGQCYATVGVHPCSAKSFETHLGGPSKLLSDLEELVVLAKSRGVAVAFGEIGLDYDRLYLTEKEQQLKYFEAQLELAVKVQLPLFLHMRAASADFERLLRPRLPHLPRRGLVHSFTGSLEEMQSLVSLNLDIGVNGCSLKTEENIEVVKAIPLERLQLETDGPWCEMRPSHASAKYKDGAPSLPKSVKKEKWEAGAMIKGRNESVTIGHVAYVVAKVKELSVEEVAKAAWANSISMFDLGEPKDPNK